ncbi:MAG: hypothetical protein CL678_03930 [Bdellovibrionaceae bacterium]|nr:hypothetical protein [Pseudobdellovibrionaceae bacterium]
MFVGLSLGLFVYYASKRRDLSREKKGWEKNRVLLEELDKEQTELAKLIRRYGGEGHCQSDIDCGVLGIGVKACCEYKDYFLYSIRDADLSKLRASVLQFNKNARKMINLSLKVPSCGNPPIDPVCKKGRCVVVRK